MVIHITTNICVVTGAHCVNRCGARCRRHVRIRWRTANNSVYCLMRAARNAPLPRPLYARGTATLTQPSARLDSAPHLNPSGLHCNTPLEQQIFFKPSKNLTLHRASDHCASYGIRLFLHNVVHNYSDLLRNPEFNVRE